MTDDLKGQVSKSLEKIRPLLQMDGGDVELVDVEGGVVKVRLKGACHGCPMSQMTLQHGIEQTLKKEVPGVERVESVDQG
ncbi:MAG: NifU family protein [Candidatus Altiarchaeota archaeon]